MIDAEKYFLSVDEMRRLYIDNVEVQKNSYLEKERTFFKYCDELHCFYVVEKENLFNKYVAPFINEYPFIEKPSSLQVIEKLHCETYHSLFLKYIWDNQNSFGYKVLSEFLNNVANDKSWFESISMRTYNVQKEVPTKGLKNGNDKKRIDLLLVDDKNKWCIAIENKINAEIHYSNKHSQLEPYYNFCEKKYKGYDKLYILLSYNSKNQCHVNDNWIYVDYYYVFKSLLKYHCKDLLIEDYLKTLFKLLFPKVRRDCYKNSTMYRSMWFYQNIILKIK
ncbi:PD-(D/E)XK nuclease family protein [Bacteroides zhangwenhongii]|uniref:PD-(D/E)XK nuclease family protein n=1 Tax=Bacteroides zhangwenhongii TaxID=2650157 RepID=UPI0022E21F5A|nr:PD-(D/E)XK nuclease family protein [Bacteroides zhangwenhongii]